MTTISFLLSLLTLSLSLFCRSSSAFFVSSSPNCYYSRQEETSKSHIRRFFSDDDSPLTTTSSSSRRQGAGIASYYEQQRQEWIDRSLTYYSKVMREERRRQLGQAKDYDTPAYQDHFTLLAKKHYFALRKIKDGKPQHAERIYRRIIDELVNEEEEQHCDHAKLAVTTLLLALLLQRIGDAKQTRSVFLHFFRVAVLDNENGECACSAKVLQAYALFEMKQGNARKSLEIVNKAVQLDPTLEPVLKWKQFRDVLEHQRSSSSSSSSTLRP